MNPKKGLQFVMYEFEMIVHVQVDFIERSTAVQYNLPSCANHKSQIPLHGVHCLMMGPIKAVRR